MTLETALLLLRSDQLPIQRFMELTEENNWNLANLNLLKNSVSRHENIVLKDAD